MLLTMPQLSLAAKFPREDQAQDAYTATVHYLAGARVQEPISIYRIEDQGHYIALVGESTNMMVWQHLAKLLQTRGQIIALDDATIDGLLAKRRSNN